MIALGLDIGGANLKGATSTGIANTEPFEIWRAPGQLATRLRSLIAKFPPTDVLAVTMTAELADCFSTKAEGVAAIVAAVCRGRRCNASCHLGRRPAVSRRLRTPPRGGRSLWPPRIGRPWRRGPDVWPLAARGCWSTSARRRPTSFPCKMACRWRAGRPT